MLVYEELTQEILGAATDAHKQIGPGRLESASEECLCRELSLRGLSFQRQVPLAIAHKGVKLDCGYKLDLVVEDKVILELKSIKRIEPTGEAQLLTYLRLSGKKVGLLINFNTVLIKDGIKRMIL
jgi:GxxExxY protein